MSGRNTAKEKEDYTQSGCHIIAASSSHYDPAELCTTRIDMP
jgi:hypothetical protein